MRAALRTAGPPAITDGRPPRTGAEDALGDIALCQAVVAQHLDGIPRDLPTLVE